MSGYEFINEANPPVPVETTPHTGNSEPQEGEKPNGNSTSWWEEVNSEDESSELPEESGKKTKSTKKK